MEFTGNYNERLPESKGLEVIQKGIKLGESNPIKDSYWAIYFYENQFFISLNDQHSDFWNADEEDAINYNERPI